MIARNTATSVEKAITVQWANAKVEAKPISSGRFSNHVGWHTEAGINAELDVQLHAAGVPRLEIKHRRAGGQTATQIVQHWDLGEQIVFYPVTAGPVTTSVADASARSAEMAAAGLGVWWTQGERSRLAVRGYLKTFLDLDFPHLVQIPAHSRMTDKLLAALVDHLRVLDAADQLIDRTMHQEPLSCHELGLPLGAGADEDWGTSATSTVVPLMSMHAHDITIEYVQNVWAPDAVLAAAEQAWPGILNWAARFGEQQSRVFVPAFAPTASPAGGP